MVIAQKVRRLRQKRGLLQCQLAAMVGIDQTTLSRYECGRYPIPDDMLAALSRALGSPELAEYRCQECPVFECRGGKSA